MTELEKKDWVADLMYELVQELNRWDKEEIVTVCKKKNFLTRCLVLHSLPPLKVTRLHYIGNRYIGRRVFPAH